MINARFKARTRERLALGAAGATVLSLAACAPQEVDQVVFQDVTQSAGLAGHTGMTHGAGWGDYDGDGLPDLYVTNHLTAEVARLLTAVNSGRFEDVTAAWFSAADLVREKHGAAWADFDTDRRQD